MMARRICGLLRELKPALLMVVVQIVVSGNNVLYKIAASYGMSLRIIVAYRTIFATAFMIPFALIFERKKMPKLTWMVLFQAFLCGLFGGSLWQNLYLESLVLTSATFATAIYNLTPAITFIVSLSFGLEKVGLATMAGKAKVGGTIMGIGGAIILTFYKGAALNFLTTHVNLLKKGGPSSSSSHFHGSFALGAFMAVGSCFCFSLWLIIQAKMSKRYPCPYSSTVLMSMMASIQSVIFTLCIEKDWNQWKLGWDIKLLTSAYSGILASGLMVTLMAWCVGMRGPVFVSSFSPLMFVLVALAGSTLLDEKLHIGSIVGSVFIICGLYAVLWGKTKEIKEMSQLFPLQSSGEEHTITSSVSKENSNDLLEDHQHGKEEKQEANTSQDAQTVQILIASPGTNNDNKK